MLCRYTHVHEDWLIGHAYMIDDFDREALDKAFPDNPVVIRAGGAHSAYLNSEALRRSGYSIETELDTQGGHFLRDAAGCLTGEMAENSMSKVCVSIPPPSKSQVKRSLKEGIHRLHRTGMTSF